MFNTTARLTCLGRTCGFRSPVLEGYGFLDVPTVPGAYKHLPISLWRPVSEKLNYLSENECGIYTPSWSRLLAGELSHSF
jgi:hypothetical protein